MVIMIVIIKDFLMAITLLITIVTAITIPIHPYCLIGVMSRRSVFSAPLTLSEITVRKPQDRVSTVINVLEE